MLKNRVLTLSVNKRDKNEVTNVEAKTFEEKTELVMAYIEDLAIKAFLGFCVYMYLDTRRQVRIEQAKQYQYK